MKNYSLILGVVSCLFFLTAMAFLLLKISAIPV
ncbi:UNVERIFIED_ORG: hypothetical protein J2Y78_000123 [Buttiauxella agrestis ATCC 33320]